MSNAALRLKEQVEIEFLKSHTYTEINEMFNELNGRLNGQKEDLRKFLSFLKDEGIVIESEDKPQDFDFLYDVWSGKNPDGLNF